ncbi:MAG: hypothetical protein AAF636_20610 [Pseudomonadota bacterium]
MRDHADVHETAAAARRIAEAIKTLSPEHAELDTRVHEENAASKQDGDRAAGAAVAYALSATQMLATLGCQSIEAQKTAAHAARFALRKFMAELNVYRPPHTPNILVILLTLMVGTIGEAVFATISLYSDGRMDLIPAMGFALTFAIMTTVLGLAAGAVLRFVGYRSKVRKQSPEFRFVRWTARFGFLSVVAVTALMIFVGGRVRVTGGTINIFSFADVGFAATFNDAMALVIMVASTLSFCLSISKGYSGFTDPLPGYAAHAGKSDEDYADEVSWTVATVLDQVDEVVDTAVGTLETVQQDPDAVDELREDTLSFNATVRSTKADIIASALADWEQQCFATGIETPKPEVDLAALDALIIDADRLPDPAPPEGLMDELLKAQTEAHTKVLTAQTEFASSLQSFRVSPPST